MKLSTKLFLGYFFVLICLLGGTLLLIRHQTEAHEMTRIHDTLSLIHFRFQDRLEADQQHTLQLVRTITLEQKFRSFLSQMKDNFYPFTEEIALDTDTDMVFMLDEASELGGLYPATEVSHAWVQTHLSQFRVKEVLDSGEASFQILPLGEELFSTVFIPLKESLDDDYAIGAIVVCKLMDDEWIDFLLGSNKLKMFGVRAVFFIHDTPVAGNISPDEFSIIMAGQTNQEGNSFSYVVGEERYIAKRELFEEKPNGESAGYLLSANLDRALRPFKELEHTILTIGLLMMLVGLIFSMGIAKRLIKPLRTLVQGTRAISQGNYDFRVSSRAHDEVGELSDAFNHMAEGLQEKERIRDSFGKYVHPSIVTQMLDHPESLKLGGRRQVQSVLFGDLANFTQCSSKMPSDVLVSWLNQYFEAMTQEVNRSHGILDKYIGDGFMAFWGEPFTSGNFALEACKGAVSMQIHLKELRRKWSEEGLPAIGMRIGIATGEMVVGNFGCESSQSYTCIGDTVNYGSRLEKLNKTYRTQIIIDQATCQLAGQTIVARELDFVQVRGYERGTAIFELIGLSEAISPSQEEAIARYQEALASYREGNFQEAEAKFSQVALVGFPDPPSEVMRLRCQTYMKNPPSPSLSHSAWSDSST